MARHEQNPNGSNFRRLKPKNNIQRQHFLLISETVISNIIFIY